jgi:hypothetical protein
MTSGTLNGRADFIFRIKGLKKWRKFSEQTIGYENYRATPMACSVLNSSGWAFACVLVKVPPSASAAKAVRVGGRM